MYAHKYMEEQKVSFRLPSYDKYIKYYAYKSMYDEVMYNLRAYRDAHGMDTKAAIDKEEIRDIIINSFAELSSEAELAVIRNDEPINVIMEKAMKNEKLRMYREYINEVTNRYITVAAIAKDTSVYGINSQLKEYVDEVGREVLEA